MMKYQNISIAAIAVALLAGCASGPTPQNAEEYRKAIAPEGSGAVFETFIVQRPYKDVTKLIKAKVQECLSANVDHQSCRRSGFMGTKCNEYSDKYLPTVIEGSQKTEVHVQFKRSGEGAGEIYLGGKPPANGRYVVVADVTLAENGKATKVEIYGNKVERSIPKAIRHWANGTNLGCPDFKPELSMPGLSNSEKK